MREVKQVIVVRSDLKMRRGKEIAQGSHASIAFLTNQLCGQQIISIPNAIQPTTVFLSDVVRQWLEEGFAKICVRVDSEEELLKLYRDALTEGLEAHLITDNGKTEFNGVSTHTCLAIGPNYSDEIDPLTSHLKLY